MRGEALTPQPRPESRKREKARRNRQQKAARKACEAAVWKRDDATCQRCGRSVVPFRECGDGWTPYRGDVNELVPRSLGGDPADPKNCELICAQCHFGGPSGAHAPTADRMVTR